MDETNGNKLQQHDDGSLGLSGALSHQGVPELLKKSIKFFDNHDHNEIVIDLKQVSRSDSSGVALLIEWMRQAKGRNKTIRFLNIPQQMLEIAKVSGVDKILAI
jgi:phospholipid transport system transporter-binding protein